MGRDTVSIVSMNSARQGMCSLPTQARGSYLNQLLNGLQPDIGVLPGDNPELKNNVLLQYDQYMTQEQNTLLLFDVNKISMKKQQVSDNIYNGIWGLNPAQLAWPEVEVSSLEPCKRVVKTFSLIAIPHTLFQTENGTVNERLLDSIIVLSQRLAIVTGNPILIAGEIRLSYEAVQTIVSRRNNTTQQQYLEDGHAFLSQFGYLPSMTKGSTRESRLMFKLDPVLCKRNDSIVKSWSQTDCFIASKALQMSEPKGIKVEEALGREIKMVALKESCVTKTEMQIPVRPPKHHGG